MESQDKARKRDASYSQKYRGQAPSEQGPVEPFNDPNTLQELRRLLPDDDSLLIEGQISQGPSEEYLRDDLYYRLLSKKREEIRREQGKGLGSVSKKERRELQEEVRDMPLKEVRDTLRQLEDENARQKELEPKRRENEPLEVNPSVPGVNPQKMEEAWSRATTEKGRPPIGGAQDD